MQQIENVRERTVSCPAPGEPEKGVHTAVLSKASSMQPDKTGDSLYLRISGEVEMSAIQPVNYADTQYISNINELELESKESTKPQIGVLVGVKHPNYSIAPGPTAVEALTIAVESSTRTSIVDAIA